MQARNTYVTVTWQSRSTHKISYVLHQVSPGSTYQLRKIVGPACYHLPGNWSTAIFHTQNVAMCTACKLIYHVTHITVKPQKPHIREVVCECCTYMSNITYAKYYADSYLPPLTPSKKWKMAACRVWWISPQVARWSVERASIYMEMRRAKWYVHGGFWN